MPPPYCIISSCGCAVGSPLGIFLVFSCLLPASLLLDCCWSFGSSFLGIKSSSVIPLASMYGSDNLGIPWGNPFLDSWARASAPNLIT